MAASAIFAIISSAVSTFGIPGLVGGAGGFAATSFVGGLVGTSAFAAFATRAAVGMALGALSKPGNPSPRGYQVPTSGGSLSHQIVYGRARTQPSRLFTTTTGTDNDRLHRILAYTGHEIDDYENFYIGNQKVTKWKNLDTDTLDVTDLSTIPEGGAIAPQEVADVDEDGNIVAGTESTRYVNGDTHYIRIWLHRGGKDQVADQAAIDQTAGTYAEWTSAHRLREIAYIYVVYQYDASGDVFPNGPPVIEAMIKGRKVYDPRVTAHDPDDDSTWEWSDNSALCLADYINAPFGVGEPWSNIDQTLLATQADICDKTPTYGDGGKLFTCNGRMTTDAAPVEIMSSMVTALAGIVWYAQGKWRMRAGEYVAPVMSFGDADLRSEVTLKTRHSRRDNFNTTAGLFAGDETNWTVTDYPQVTNITEAGNFVADEVYTITDVGDTDFTAIGATSNTKGVTFVATGAGTGTGTANAFLGADNGVESILDLDLPFTDNSIEARRIARIALERNRQQLSFSAAFNMRALRLQIGDTMNMTVEQFGWTDKTFEVVGFGFGVGSDNSLAVRLELQEISSEVFDEVDDGVVYERDNTSLPDAFTTSDVTFSSLNVQLVATPSGSFTPIVLGQWTQGNIGFIREYVFQWRENNIDYAGNGGFVTLDSSATTRQTDIYNAYLNTLYRVPDQDGFDTYDGGALTIAEITADLIGSAEYTSQGRFSSMVGSTTQGEVRGLSLDQRYDFRIMTRNYFNQVGAIDTTTIEVSDDTTAPPVPTFSGVSNSVIGQQVTFRWVNPATDGGGDPVYDRAYTDVWRGAAATLTLDGSGDPTNAVQIGTVPSPGAEIIDTSGSASTTYYYFARAVDFSGNKSAFSSGIEIDTDAELEDGLAGLTPVITPSQVGVPADQDGNVSNYSGSGCRIYLKEGDTYLGFTTGSLTNGSFRIYDTDVYTDGTPSSDITVGSISDGGVYALVANHSSMDDLEDSVEIRYDIQYQRVSGEVGTLTISQTVSKNTEGDIGSTGEAAIDVRVSRPVATVYADESGVVDSYADTGCTIQVYEGDTLLSYDITPDGADWEVVSTSVSPSGDISVGSISNGVVTNHSSMDNNTDEVTLTFNISGKRSDGTSFSRTAQQVVRKVFSKNKIANQTVFYQTLQASSPSTPSASAYNFTTGVFTGLTAGWGTEEPATDLGSATKKIWSSQVAISENGVTGSQSFSFRTPVGVNQFANQVIEDLLAAGAVTSGKLADLAVTLGKLAADSVDNSKIVDDAVDAAKIAANAVGSDHIDALAVTAAKVAANAITVDKIAANAVTTAKLADGAGTEAKIATGAITETKIGANAVSTAKIAAGAVTAGEIAAGTITASEIAAGAITASEIAAGTVTAANIAAGTITASEIATGTITASEIAAGAITATELAANSVTSASIAAGTIQAGDIAAGTITASEIAANTITGSNIAANTISASEIVANTITASEIASNAVTADKILAGAITTAKIAAGAITATEIAAGTITASEIAAGTVTASEIAAGTITSTELAADSVTATEINVANLAAIESDLGAIDGGSLNITDNIVSPPITVGVKIRPNTASASPSAATNDTIWGVNYSNAYVTAELSNLSDFGVLKLAGGVVDSGGDHDVLSATGTGGSGSTVGYFHNTGAGGGEAQIALSSSDSGYAFNAVDGGYYDQGGDGYGPFTGRHDGFVKTLDAAELGDILVDGAVIVRSLSDSVTVLHRSTSEADQSAIGVLVDRKKFTGQPMASVSSGEPLLGLTLEDLKSEYDLAKFNALGEGAVNVCGAGGSIKAGDLIQTSAIAGKGMRQADGVIRNYTVAKAREDVSFASEDEIKLVACIYLCG